MSFRKTSTTSLAAGALVAALAGVARAAPLPVTEYPRAPELSIVHQAYAPFLKAHPEVRVLTTVVNLDGGSTDSIVTRFESKLTCQGASCLYTVLSYNRNSKRWFEAFSQHTESLSLGPKVRDDTGRGATDELITSNGIAWHWFGGGINDMRFEPTLASVGAPWGGERLATQNEIDAAKPFLLDKLPAQKGIILTFTARPFELGDKKAVVVAAQSVTYCGSGGCPFAIVDVSTGTPSLMFKSWGPGAGAVMESSSNGRPDIALSSRDGLDFLSFDGGAYRLVQTTYPSKTTPAP